MRIKSILIYGILALSLCFSYGCKSNEEETPNYKKIPKEIQVEGEDYFLPHIDLRNWKVTLPIGRPTEVYPPAILDYSTNNTLEPYMYNDSSDGSLVFYTTPGTSTANSSYSRTELRELLDGGDGKTNWKFADGGRMKGRLKIGDVHAGPNGYDKTIVMQIHGRLTDAQKTQIGAKDNNAPPILKLSWQSGKIRVYTKVLTDTLMSDEEALQTDSWGDAAVSFKESVNFDEFTLEIIASDGRLEVILNDDESMVFDDVHMRRWGIFDNYFKAGNYLQNKEAGAYANVKYYDLEVTH
ncbi:MAG: polysaccharide lyase family 7 protein [Bacteroidia bacterium]|jgi:hypothetical protein|tara:strand:+ start:5642 stop:6529 length:888 start_codon:yes stop_codon:yes gene_type:complete